MRKKKMYIRNGIVFDPNIEEDFMDSGYEESIENKKIYRQGKTKRKVYKNPVIKMGNAAIKSLGG